MVVGLGSPVALSLYDRVMDPRSGAAMSCPGGSPPEAAVPGRWGGIACLSTAPWNPYLRLLYRHLAEYGFHPVPEPRLRAGWLWRNRRRAGFLHVHWPESLYRFRRGPRLLRPLLSWVKLALFAARLAWARLLGYRIVWTVHQLYPHERESRLGDRLAARLLGRASSLLLAHDRATADAIREALPEVGDRLQVVPHGSYVGVYPPGRSRQAVRRELGIPEDAFVFLSFGELRAYKDLGLLIEAFQGSGLSGARLVVAGHPKDPRVERVVREAAAADARIVPLLGWIADSGVAELFGACDAAVVARSDGGTSGSLILAMSLGLPVVAADRPAYRDLLDGGRAGWLFSPGDPGSLAARLMDAAGDRPGAVERGRRAYEVAERLSWPDIAARTASALRAAVPSSAPLAALGELAGSLPVAGLLLAVGAGLRLAQFASGRSLWLDESYLALNVLQRSYGGLLGTLDYAQGAPPGFLLAVKLFSDVLGGSEEALRATALAAGLAALPLFHGLARLTLAPWAANLALCLFAVGGGLIRYSSELKPYAVDVAATLFIAWVFLSRWRRGLALRDGALVGASGLAAVLVSYGALFALAAAAAAGLVAVAVERRRAAVPGLTAAVAPWLGALAAVYFLLVPHVHHLQETAFRPYYLPLPPSSWGDLGRLVGAAAELFTHPVGVGLPRPVAVVAGALVLLGAWSLARRRPFFVLLWALLFAAVLLASALDRYPWGGRFTLFLIPFLLLAVAAGIGRLGEMGGQGRLVAAAVAALVLAVPVGKAAYHLVAPRTVEEMEPLLRRLAQRWRPGDTLYLNASAQYAFRYYSQYRGMAVGEEGRALWPLVPAPGGRSAEAPALRSRPPALVVGRVEDETGERLVARVRALLGERPRLWVLLSHLPEAELGALPVRLRGAVRAELVRRPGAALYLYRRP